MIARAKVVALALLALLVPGLALGGETAPAGPQGLSVGAGLDGCGVAETTIVCRIATSWNALEGAEYYTVSVTRPDGSVVDAGQSAGTSQLAVVPYVGPGTYSVRVAAWATPPGKGEPEVIDEADAGPMESTGGGNELTSGLPKLQDRTNGPELPAPIATEPEEQTPAPEVEPAPAPVPEPEPCEPQPIPEPAHADPSEPAAAEPASTETAVDPAAAVPDVPTDCT